VSPGSEPERDDTGLPPVDIEIPDDARDLDRDVQAYYRELRASRRQQRGLRMRGSLGRDGVVLPLLACCLILALITGTLLTVFTATSGEDFGLPGAGRSPGHPPASAGARSGGPSAGANSPTAPSANRPQLTTVAAARPPAATITPDGQRPIAVQGLRHATLVLIPARCGCTAAVSWLIGVAAGAHATTYLIYTTDTQAAVRQLWDQLTVVQQRDARLAFEPTTALRSSVPARLPGNTLTAIMLGRSKILYASVPGPNYDPTPLIEALTH
jgi:hypothetical protein